MVSFLCLWRKVVDVVDWNRRPPLKEEAKKEKRMALSDFYQSEQKNELFSLILLSECLNIYLLTERFVSKHRGTWWILISKICRIIIMTRAEASKSVCLL
jgi:hypothetical protein